MNQNLESFEGMNADFLIPGQDIPLVFIPENPQTCLVNWITENKLDLLSLLNVNGALLFRGFNVDAMNELAEIIRIIAGEPMDYINATSPRTRMEGNIFSATDYTPDQLIFPHNELSYSSIYPEKILFGCVVPPGEGGETPIGDVRKVMKRIDPLIVNEFKEKNILYVRTLCPNKEMGLSWMETFKTENPSEVEKACQDFGMDFKWLEDKRLQTRYRGPAVIPHPQTGEEVWFNQILSFHIKALEPKIQKVLTRLYDESELPQNAYYGDGSPIDPDVLENIREAYLAEMVSFKWEQGDILLLDNILTFHSRNPYTPPRQIIVGMS